MTEKLFTGTLNHNQNKNKQTNFHVYDFDVSTVILFMFFFFWLLMFFACVEIIFQKKSNAEKYISIYILYYYHYHIFLLHKFVFSLFSQRLYFCYGRFFCFIYCQCSNIPFAARSPSIDPN